MILDMTHGELKLLAKHLGHDVKTHKEYYQLSSSTMELSKVALMLYAVENGKVNEWKGRQMKDIVVEDLPLPIEDEDGHQEESMSTADSEEPGSVTHDRREPSEEPASLSHDRREPNPQESMSTADSEEPGSLTHDRREPSEEPASLSHDRRKPSEEPASLTHESMSTADSEEPGSLTHDRREPSEEPASLTHDRREPSEEPASLTHESMSTAASEGPASLTHDEMRQPNPQGTGTRKGMKRKWASEENICFMNFFRDELREKKMPSGSKIMGSLKILTGRTVAQIRARVHNIIMEKQKWKKNC
ncbi:cytochrome c1-like isoform X8 [Dreissena polymorpha]|uniref:cytochrome c1-like isoform X8 n=3 Tax=Dreissena polymorpha TaxID=45954 RepID=UPI0022644451|nr:cytochrome c1-like isoform X8 [Dreissena polymorpha]XP_052248028.1 cytochrome c1-like isoform X11 [Dreissena polymorpha]XP_052284656.1 cytochrome c1-like isoform X8 [Dreissena polymorpha]